MSASSSQQPQASPLPPTPRRTTRDQAPRYLAIWLPHLPTDRLRRNRAGAFCGLPDDVPLVVFERIKAADVLVAVDAAALRLGLKPGLSLADARARLPHLYATPAAPGADADLLDRLAADCDRYTPLVGRDAPDGVILNITGAAHLLGGEAALRDAVAGRLRAAGLAARIAIAGAPDTARALARYGRARGPLRGNGASDLIVPEGGDAAAVWPLPVAALGLPQETVTGLVRAGLKTIGCLARRPRAPLAARFGAGLHDRLERTLGHMLAPISPWRPEPVAHADLACGEPIVRSEDIDTALGGLAIDLAATLHAREQGARRVEVAFFRVDGHVRRLEVAMARPSRDPAAMTRLIAERLAALASPLDPGFGFDRIRLAALLAEPLPATQSDLTPTGVADDDDGLPELIDRLSARLGAARVVRCQPCDSHIPERATVFVPATAHVAGRASALPPSSRETWPVPEPDEPPSRPAGLFDPPQPIEAMAPVPDGPPLRFRWRRVVHDVVLAEGPERIAPEWWRLTGRPHAAEPQAAATRTAEPQGTQSAPPIVRRKTLPREDIPPPRAGGGTAPSPLPFPSPDARDAAPRLPSSQDLSPRRDEREDVQQLTDWLAEVRDYYRVEDRNGRRYWLFRAGLWQPGREPPRWFMHGLYA